jgi:hypothetical protein
MIAHSSRRHAALCVMLAWCSQAARAAALPVRVVASVSILEDIVRRSGGGELEYNTAALKEGMLKN